MSNRIVPFPGTFDQREERTVMVPVARLVLRATAGPLRGQVFTFDGGPFVIGRGANCTIAIPSQAVSRAHARIEFGNGSYWIIPEKTVNGTRVNGNLVQEATQLTDRDKVAIDDSAFVVSCREPGQDLDFEDLAAPPPPVAQAPAPRFSQPTMPAVAPAPAFDPRFSQPQMDVPRYSQPQMEAPYPYYPPPYPYPAPPPPAKRGLGVWLLAGIGLIALVGGVVVATVKLMGPTTVVAPAPPPRAPAPVVVEAPKPAPPPVVVEAPKPVPAAPLAKATLVIANTPVIALSRGTVVDVVKLGTAVTPESGIGHVRLYSANFDAAQAKLASLQKKYGTSEDYADFIAQAKQDYLAAARRREVKPIEATTAGTVTKVKIRPGDELRTKQVVAEVATAKLTAPAEAIEGAGTKCTITLGSGAKLAGTLLAAGSTERMIELDRVPKDVPAGNLGDVVIHCE